MYEHDHDDAVAAMSADIERLASGEMPIRDMLQNCVECLVERLKVAFARVWILDDRTDVLVLRASAGQYTHLDGRHSRISVGAFKIGRIAQQRLPHLTNDVVNDPFVDSEWASREGMIAFAGYPLLVGTKLVGVLGMFARHPLSPTVLDELHIVADAIAIGVMRRQMPSAA